MRGLYCIVFLLMAGFTTYSQSIFLQTRGSEGTVCGDSLSFTIEVRNVSTQTLTNVVVNSDMPPGIFFALETSATPAHQSGSSANNPFFTVGTLIAGQVKFFSYKAITNCSLVEYLNDNSIVDGIVKNQTTATFGINGGASNTYQEPQGSESYNIRYPVLTLRIDPADKDKYSSGGDQVTRRITITNTGNGALLASNAFLEITREAGLAFVSINGVGLTHSTSGNVTTVRFNDFMTAPGDDNVLAPGESIALTETVRVLACSDVNLSSDYFVKWGCQSLVCNISSTNAQDASLIRLLTAGSPQIVLTDTKSGPFSFCGDPITVTFEFKNTRPAVDAATDRSNRATHVALMLYESELGFTKLSDFKVLNKAGQWIPITPLISGGYYFGPAAFSVVAGGVAGMSDIDGNGVFDDILPQDKLTVSALMTTSCPQFFANPEANPGYAYFYKHNLIFYNACEQAQNYFRNEDYFYYANNSPSSFSGPTDLTPGQTGTYTFNINRYFYAGELACTDNSLTSVVSFPSLAYKVTEVKWIPTSGSTTLLTFSQDPNGTLRITGGGWEGRYEVKTTMDCDLGTTSTASSILQWSSYYNCSGTCCSALIAQRSYEIFNHCGSGGGGQCLRTSGFTVERATFGYPQTGNGRHYMQLPSTRLNRNSPGIRLNAAMETDNILAVARGSVASGTFDNAHVEIQYTSLVDDNILEFVSGYFVVNSGGTPQNVNVTTPPVITSNGRDHFFDFKVDGISSFATNTSIDLFATFRIRKSNAIIAGEQPIPKFRAYHYGISGGNRFGCESFGSGLTVVKTYYRAVNSAYSSGFGCSVPMITEIVFDSNGANSNVDPFPNEFRPNSRVREIKLVIPKGTNYATGSGTFRFGSSSKIGVQDPTTSTRADGSTELTWSTDKLPVADVIDNLNLIFNFSSNAVCYPQLPVSPVVAANVTYTNYDSDESGPAVQTFTGNYSFSPYTFNIEVQANIIQDAFLPTVSWPVNLCDSSPIDPDKKSWITFDPPSNVNLLSAKLGDVELEIIQYDANAPHKRLIKMPQLGGNGVCHSVTFTASYSSCKENVIDEIILRVGRNCGEYPTIPTDRTTCSSIGAVASGKLFIRYKNADLSQLVRKLNAKSNLCEPIPYEVELLSSGVADMRDVYTVIKRPTGIIFKPGSAFYKISTSGSDTWVPLSDPTAINVNNVEGDGWNLSNAVLNGNVFVNQSRILLRFELEAECSGSFETNYDPGIPVIITSTGTTNCNDLVTRSFQSKIEINGFDVSSNLLSPNVDIQDICINRFSPVSISITNRGLTTSIPQDLVVNLPAGTTYLGLVDGAPTPFSIVKTDGITTITWKLNPIAVGETLSGFNFVMAVSNQALASVLVETRTYIFGNGLCTRTGQQCSLRATTGLSQVNVPVKIENCYQCSTPAPVVTSVCAGREETAFNAWDNADIQVSCTANGIVISNNGSGYMTDSLTYVAYYGNASGVIEQIVRKKFKLAAAESLVISQVSSGRTMVRLETEQSPFNTHNSGVIATFSQGTGTLCSRMNQVHLTPTPLSWNFGDGETLAGSNVKHTYEYSGDYTVTLTYCGSQAHTIEYEALDCQIYNLYLSDECSNDPQTYRWRIYNPNSISVTIQYELVNSPFHGSVVAQPDGNTIFYTPVMAGNRTLRVQWRNERNEIREAVRETNGDVCGQDECDNCFSSFSLLEGKEYILSAWVKEETLQPVITYVSAAIALEFTSDETMTNTLDFRPTGAIIDGWQRIWTKFTVPDNVSYLTIRLLNDGGNEVYFDDVRIHPFNSNIKSYVYDPGSQRLMAELDENNYATFYEYDEEGTLIRVKKETERGVKTIQETRNNNVKVSHGQ